MQNSSAFQYLAIDTIHESTTNPRRTFDEAKLQELAAFVPGHKMLRYVPLIILWPNQHRAASSKAVRVLKGT
jgi:hypothetical protein